MDRATKLRKLNAFRRRLPHASASALAAIIADIKRNGIPDGDRNSMMEARNLICKEWDRYGSVLQSITVFTKEDEETTISIAHPMALLWMATQDCAPFSIFFRAALHTHPPSPEEPWNLVLYSDEVTPGNPLATLNHRKFQAIYWSFLEFGANALCREEAWFCICAEYSGTVNQLSAGLSQLIAALIKVFFDPDGDNFATTGMSLPFDGEDIRLWAQLTGLIQDGGAHKSTFHSRGDGASKFCLLCQNLFSQESKLVEEDGSGILACNVLKCKDLVPATGKGLRKVARYLERHAGTCTADEFVEKQQALGMTYHPRAILLDRSFDSLFDPVKIYMHDWMHCLFVDGVFNLCLYLLLETMLCLGHSGIYDLWSDYLAEWVWPMRITSAHLHEIFSADRKKSHRDAKHIKCQASDGLSISGVAALWCLNFLLKLDGRCKPQVDAFVALVDVIDLIMATYRMDVPAAQLLAVVENFLDLFKKAWGCEWMIPKFHWLLHFPAQLSATKFGKLLNCFCLERKHRVAKRYAEQLTNTSRETATSLIMEVICHNLGQLTNNSAVFSFGVGLVGGKAPSKAVRARVNRMFELDNGIEVLCSIESRFSATGTCKVSDVVIFNDNGSLAAGKVQLHCSFDGVAVSMLSLFEFEKKSSKSGFSTWRNLDDVVPVETQHIVDAVVYSILEDGRFGVLLPIEYR